MMGYVLFVLVAAMLYGIFLVAEIPIIKYVFTAWECLFEYVVLWCRCLLSVILYSFCLLPGLLMHVWPWCMYAEATPKAIMRTMGVKGLTLFHLKSHLQVYTRLIIIQIWYQSTLGRYKCDNFISNKFLIGNFFLCIRQKYRLGKQSGKDMGEAPKDGAWNKKN